MHKKLAIIGIFAIPLVAVGLWTNTFIAAAHSTPQPMAIAPPQKPIPIPATPQTPKPRPLRILIVPGHEPNAGGASYRNVYERNLTVELGNDLRQYLQADSRFDVTITRDTAAWNPTFAEYFANHSTDINAWQKAAEAQMHANIASGQLTLPAEIVDHPSASPSAAEHLYGVTKWANENAIDIMIHIHFNDDRMTRWASHTRSGFAVYAPVPQFKNSEASHVVASDVYKRLAALNPTSDFAGEDNGIVDDSQLIALGEYDTANAARILIEYDYIYERQYGDAPVRDMALKDMAYQTYLGLKDFAGEDSPGVSGTSILPHTWRKPMTSANANTGDVFALQTALIADGDFIITGDRNNTCRRNGLFGPCTRAALKRFQKKYGIAGEDGIAGKKTLAKLNALWSKH